MSAASAPPQTATQASKRFTGKECPECMDAFSRAHPRQIFCCRAHKRAWETRNRNRGMQLLPFAVASRVTRGGTRGKIFTGVKAQRDLDMLIGRWRDEDRAAGRMDQVDYLDLRYMLGFERP